VRWSVTIPGQPVSWDHAYITGRMPVRRKGVQLYREDGSPKMINRPIKTDAAAVWQRDVELVAQAAKPSGWPAVPCVHHTGRRATACPAPQIRLTVDMILADDMDDDNALKLARDAFARAIDYDDIHFLVCTRSKEVTDDPRLASITITVDDNTGHV
jgi:hypothetical protein